MILACPKCRSDVPGPHFRRGKGGVRVRCKVCRALLEISRPPEVQQEFDSADFLGKALTLPGYEVLGVLGRGGMGVVYSAVRQSDHELVAVKVLPAECLRYPELVKRFEFEAQTMAQLSHPGIVPIIDRGRWENHPFIVMDYIPGCNLKDRIERHAPLPIDEVLAVATPVAEAVQRCHEAGFVHRDLKPGNVLLSQSGRVLVTDFGIANLIHLLGDQTDHGVTIGTPQYVAPEQLRDGSAVDVRADQYSLAVIIFEMITGELPVGVFEPPSKRHPDLVPEAEAVLFRALARRSAERFDSMRQFMRAFRRALQRPSGTPEPEEIIQAAITPAPIEPDYEPLPIGLPTLRIRVVPDDEPEAETPAGPASGEFDVGGALDFEAVSRPTPLPGSLIEMAEASDAPAAPAAEQPTAPPPQRPEPTPTPTPPPAHGVHLLVAIAGIAVILALAAYILSRVF
ncbi:MAG: serine/threonine protein kinase [Candidatus Sumerlaeia bacterium]|nr:serine/threonine protein kinase [Candidatus Sumerlaeia bacterium]